MSDITEKVRCTDPNPNPDECSVAESMAYYGGGSAVAEAEDDTDDDVDYGAPERLTFSTPEELHKLLMEAIEEDDGVDYPLDDVVDEILRDIENGTI